MQCDICGDNAWHVCGRSGRPLCPKHSRVEVVSRLSFGSSDNLSVREASPADARDILNLTVYFREGTTLDCAGQQYDIMQLPAFLVTDGASLVGVLTYTLEPESLVIVNMDVLPGHQGIGAGKMLVDSAKSRAVAEGKSAVLATAMNDELPALYFYQKNGFRIYDVNPVPSASQAAVKVGFAGIPVRDEICLRFRA